MELEGQEEMGTVGRVGEEMEVGVKVEEEMGEVQGEVKGDRDWEGVEGWERADREKGERGKGAWEDLEREVRVKGDMDWEEEEGWVREDKVEGMVREKEGEGEGGWEEAEREERDMVEDWVAEVEKEGGDWEEGGRGRSQDSP